MIEVLGKEVRISLNKAFYDISAVKESIKDFKEVCYGYVSSKDSINIVLKPKDKRVLCSLGPEFCNYVLGMMKNKALV